MNTACRGTRQLRPEEFDEKGFHLIAGPWCFAEKG